MLNMYSFIAYVVLLNSFLHLARCSGSLEVRLISSRSCLLKFCVKKPHAKPLDSCLLESQLIQLQSQQQRLVTTPFYFPFPETFLLVTEIYDSQRVLLFKNTSKETFMAGTEFVPAEGSSDFLDVAFRATCHPSYYGRGCQRYCKASFGYTCDAQGKRVCLDGWTGDLCDKPICEDGCEHGRCVEPGRCECDHGFFGPTCKECRRSDKCRNGKCRDNKPFTCECEPGWGGIFCERDLEYCTRHQPCKNGGVCSNGGVRSDFTCRCEKGFMGSTCELEVPSICQHPAICRNGGVCTTVDSKLGRCECAAGFEGRYCERRIVNEHCPSITCKNGGLCITGPTCECPLCFSGADCSVIDEKCLWQRANTTQNSMNSSREDPMTNTSMQTRILMLMAFASILVLAMCVVVFFLKYSRMKRLLRDPLTQNAINEQRQQHELPKRSIDYRSGPDEAYKVFVIPSKKCKEIDDADPTAFGGCYEARYVTQPRGRYCTLPCATSESVAEPEHHYAEIEFRPTTVSLDDKDFTANACVV
ncbi:hypothetical protein Q1695_002874 [Nippostrongylus brasiliensis]|nr:hypothetical protein Q1695_002874 [Nippostrongylus brasiliensis]